MVAAPNISKDGVPIRFLVSLSNPAWVHLSLFTLAGEQVYDISIRGVVGVNSIVWKLENQMEQAVASGLYISMIQVNDGKLVSTKTGKVVILH